MAEVKRIFTAGERRGYFATTTRVGPAAHVVTDEQYLTMRDIATSIFEALIALDLDDLDEGPGIGSLAKRDVKPTVSLQSTR